jgi:glycosyltransferase involved in cell wall biosynthesis
MKVLMLGWELPPHNSGGLGVACYQLCQSLANKDIDLEFILPYRADHDHGFMKVTAALPQDVSMVMKAGIAYDSQKYIFSDGHEEYHDIFSQQAMYERAVARMAETTEFDIVHAHDWLTFRAGLRLKMLTGRPLVLHVHSIESDRAGGNHGNPAVREIEGTAFQLADRILAVSNHTRIAIHRDYGIPLDKIEVVHNSIDLNALPDQSDDNCYRYLQQLKGQGYKVVSNVGRLTLQKNLPNLLNAAKLVVEREPKTIFLLVGAGEQYEELVQQSANLGIGKNVIFAGFQRGLIWRDSFAISDLFVMPSISEPFGLTPLEAANFGAPSLISKQSGVAEVLTGALKVDFWDNNELANQIIAELRNEPLRRTLLERAQAEIASMSWQKAADTIYDIYHEHVGTEAVVA